MQKLPKKYKTKILEVVNLGKNDKNILINLEF